MVALSADVLALGALAALLLPMVGGLANGLGGSRMVAAAPWLAVGAMAGAWSAALISAAAVLSGQTLDLELYRWIHVGQVHIAVGLLVDQLTAVMVVVLTTVGLAAHLYAVGSMRGEEEAPRFFALLNLSVGAALLVVLASSYALMYVGWAGVGVCSFLLIGFHRQKATASAAAARAALIDRIGAAGFALGMLWLLLDLGTLDCDGAGQQVAGLAGNSATAVCLLFFVAAAARSAQVPFHLWIADVAQAPPAAAALICAATAGTGGAYLIARAHELFARSSAASQTMAVLGITTALLAATMALAARNPFRALGHAAASQLGFVFAALGLGVWSAGVYHLCAQAVFTALLLLGLGSAVRVSSEPEDLADMGGLRARLPVTFWCFLVGALAMAGVPPLAGFWSRNQILTAALDSGHLALWTVGCAAAWFTALYSFRLVFRVFLGRPCAAATTRPEGREAPLSTILPLIFLAILCAGGGLVGLVAATQVGARALAPLLGWAQAAGVPTVPHAALALVSTGVAVAGILLAWALYGRAAVTPSRVDPGLLGRLPAREYYLPEAGVRLVLAPVMATARFLWDVVDTIFIELICVHGSALCVRALAWGLARAQTGAVGSYALVAAIGVAVMLLSLTR